jgi:hypothetical protein
LGRANDIPEPAPYSIPNDGASYVLWRNETRTEGFFIFNFKRTQDEQPAALRGPLPFHPRKLGWEGETLGLGEG